MSTEARRVYQELQRAGVDIYSEEGQAIAALVEQLTVLEQQEMAIAETMDFVREAAGGIFVTALTDAKNLGDVIQDLGRQFAALFANRMFQQLWSGTGLGGGGLSGLLGGLFRADGGPVQAGMPYVVNENTPNSELFVPSRSGAILNVSQAQEALSDSAGKRSGATVNQVFNIKADDANSFGRSQRQIMRRAKTALGGAL